MNPPKCLIWEILFLILPPSPGAIFYLIQPELLHSCHVLGINPAETVLAENWPRLYVAPLVTNGVRLLSSGSTKLTTVKERQQGWRKGVWDTKVSQKANLLTKKTSDMSKGSNKRKHRFPLSQQKPTHSKVSLLTIPEFRWETKEIFCCPKVFWKAHLRWEVCSYWIYSVFLNCMCRWSSTSIVYSTCEHRGHFSWDTTTADRAELFRIQCIYWSSANDIQATCHGAKLQMEDRGLFREPNLCSSFCPHFPALCRTFLTTLPSTCFPINQIKNKRNSLICQYS